MWGGPNRESMDYNSFIFRGDIFLIIVFREKCWTNHIALNLIFLAQSTKKTILRKCGGGRMEFHAPPYSLSSRFFKLQLMLQVRVASYLDTRQELLKWSSW